MKILIVSKKKLMTLSSNGTYNNLLQNLSNDEFIAFQNLSKNKDLIIQKSEKGNYVVIFDRHMIT